MGDVAATAGKSLRRIVLDAVERAVDGVGRPLRFSEIADVLATSTGITNRRRVYGALDSLSRTGELSVVAKTYGLRSGGTRLYWPSSRATSASHAPAPRSLGQLIEARIALIADAASGEFSVTSLLTELQQEASRLGLELTWAATYAVLRNLERRRAPLVIRKTDSNGHVRWRWLGDAAGRRTDGTPLRCFKRESHAGRLAPSKTLRDAAIAVEAATGHHAFTIRELLEYAPEHRRDAIRAEVRRAIDHAQRHPNEEQSAERREHCSIRVRGWFGNDCYIELGGVRVDGAGTLTALRIGLLTEVLRRQWKASARLLLKWSGFELLAQAHYQQLARRKRVLNVAIKSFESRFPFSTRREGIRDDSEVLEALVLCRGVCTSPMWPHSNSGLRWASAEAVRTRLGALVGPTLPSLVLVRRTLRESAVWRRWSKHGHWGPNAAGREPLVWDFAGALLLFGRRLGGPRTRAILGVAERLVGQARPSPEVALELVRKRSDAVALLAYYALCDGSTADSAFFNDVGASGPDAAEWSAWLFQTRRAQIDVEGSRPGEPRKCPWLE